MLKLGWHFMEPAMDIIERWPRHAVSKWIVPRDGGFYGGHRVKWLDNLHPDAVAIGHVQTGELLPGTGRYGLGEFFSDHTDPSWLAQAVFNEWQAPILTAVEYRRFDFWETCGGNEFVLADEYNKGEQVDWFARYNAEFARLCVQAGTRACIGQWSTGNPTYGDWYKYYRPALDAAIQYGALLSRHEYGPIDTYNGLRYQMDDKFFTSLHKKYYHLPIVITECGLDNIGRMDVWRNYYGWTGSDENALRAYVNDYLAIYQRKLMRDNYCLGATLFTVGNGGSPAWDAFNVVYPKGVFVDELEKWSNSNPSSSNSYYVSNCLFLNVRWHPWIGDNIIHTLVKGSIVEVICSYMGTNWKQVKGSGWVHGNYLKKV